MSLVGTFRASRDVRLESRLCENVREPRMPRIVFSFAFFRQKLPVQLVSTATKSRWKFHAQVGRRSFHTAWTRNRRRGLQMRATTCVAIYVLTPTSYAVM